MVVEHFDAHFLKLTRDPINKGSILAREGKGNLVRFRCPCRCGGDPSRYKTGALRLNMLQEQLTNPPKISILEEKVPDDRWFIVAEISSPASPCLLKKFL